MERFWFLGVNCLGFFEINCSGFFVCFELMWVGGPKKWGFEGWGFEGWGFSSHFGSSQAGCDAVSRSFQESHFCIFVSRTHGPQRMVARRNSQWVGSAHQGAPRPKSVQWPRASKEGKPQQQVRQQVRPSRRVGSRPGSGWASCKQPSKLSIQRIRHAPFSRML